MTAEPGHNTVRRAILWMARSLLLWTLVALVDLAPNLFERREPGELNSQQFRYLVTHASMWFGCWLLTPLVFYLGRRFRFDAGKRGISTAVHSLAALVHAELNGALAILVVSALHLRSISFPIFPLPGILQYVATLTFATILMMRERERDHEVARSRLETQLSKARVQALTAQLRPHFLYNALNGVAMLIRARAHDAALESVLGYGELLRTVLDADAADVPLRQELAFMDKYLAIERMRFPDTFSVSITADESIGDALVPNLILQPLVENAMHHGLRDLESDARLVIAASRHHGGLRLEVRDNGVGFPEGWRLETTTGVGLRNTQARLRQRYGDAHHFELHSPPDGGTVVIVEVPWQTAPAALDHADANAELTATRIRTLVVDDEKLARTGLCAMLANDPALQVEPCGGGRDAVKIIRSTPVELVFLDVQMPRMSGFDVIASIGAERMPVVVFTTAFDAYAIQAFEACALDYLLKPIREARLMQAVARAKEAVRQRRLGQVSDQLVSLLARHPAQAVDLPAARDVPLTPAPDVAGPLRRVLLRSGARTYYVDDTEIDWIEADKYYARIWTGVRSHLLRQSLSELETLLDPKLFVRVHRSAIVNVARVTQIRQVGIARYAVVLKDRTQIPLSRNQRGRLHTALRLHSG